MRRPILILVLLPMLCASTVLAAHSVAERPRPENQRPEDLSVFLARVTFLSYFDNQEEVRLLIESCEQEVNGLLADLAGATTEREAGALIREIHRTETERDIAILEIFIRNADASGQYCLAKAMRDRVDHMRKYGSSLEIASAR